MPAAVLRAFGGSGGHVTVRALAHPWGWASTFAVRGANGVQFALRRWRGAEARARMRREAVLLRALCDRGFDRLARPEPTVSGAGWYDAGDESWTRYEWVTGAALDDASPAVAQVVGPLLAELHAASRGAQDDGESRIAGVPAAVRAIRPLVEGHTWLDLLDARAREIAARTRELEALPRAIVHGDAILDNVIRDDSTFRLVDFEFVRRDVRIFDLASAIAPRRLADGRFELAAPAYTEALVRAYADAVLEPMTPPERALLPLVTAAHWMLVTADVVAHDPRAASCVLPVLERACCAAIV